MKSSTVTADISVIVGSDVIFHGRILLVDILERRTVVWLDGTRDVAAKELLQDPQDGCVYKTETADTNIHFVYKGSGSGWVIRIPHSFLNIADEKREVTVSSGAASILDHLLKR